MAGESKKIRQDRKVYIPGLNGVRAIAALIVLFSHIDEFSYRFGLPEIGFFAKGLAGYGVTMFFTLSGFLITYLLLIEKEKKINIGRFYVRRILRIWPIYYLVIFITGLLFFFMPQLKPGGNLAYCIGMYLFFLPNLAYALNLTITTITPLWSVGVEEQFYLIWPWLIRKFNNSLKTSVFVIVTYFIVKLLARYSGNEIFYSFIWNTRIDCMAIGGIGAYLVYEDKKKVLAIIFNRITEISAWLLLLYSLLFRSLHVFTLIDHEMYSLIFLMIILNAGFNQKVIISLENRGLNFIGKISYGIYVYHMLAIVLLEALFKKYSIQTRLGIVQIYILIVTVTLLIAYLSYRYFESYFLRLKSKYTVVTSTNDPGKIYDGSNRSGVISATN